MYLAAPKTSDDCDSGSYEGWPSADVVCKNHPFIQMPTVVVWFKLFHPIISVIAQLGIMPAQHQPPGKACNNANVPTPYSLDWVNHTGETRVSPVVRDRSARQVPSTGLPRGRAKPYTTLVSSAVV